MNKQLNKCSQRVTISKLCVGSVFFTTEKYFHIKYSTLTSEYGDVVIGGYDGKIAILEFGSSPSSYSGMTAEWDDKYISDLLSNETVDLLLIGTPFQYRVWKQLLTLTKTISYSELARSMGIATSTRAVASAVARNKIAYLVPCHLVLPINGTVGNYRWGSDLKSTILNSINRDL